MLEDLDKIDWANLLHAYGAATDVPDLIRTILQSDEAKSTEALGELINSISHQGTIYPVTAHVVPFMNELLSVDHFQRKDYLLVYLRELIKDCDWSVRNMGIRQPALQCCLDTYTAVSGGAEIYRRVSEGNNIVAAIEAIRLLASLKERAVETAAYFWERILSSDNTDVKSELIYSIGLLWRYLPREAISLSTAFLRELLHSEQTPLERIATAKALIYTRVIGIKDEERAILIENYLNPLDAPYRDYVLDHNFQEKWHTFKLLSTQDNIPTNLDTLVVMFQIPDLSLEDVHSIGREIVDLAFERLNKNNGWGYERYPIDPTQRRYGYYVNNTSKDFYRANKSLTAWQQSALIAIVASDRFWQIPTNLFSFFYGLPDSREDLRKLVAES